MKVSLSVAWMLSGLGYDAAQDTDFKLIPDVLKNRTVIPDSRTDMMAQLVRTEHGFLCLHFGRTRNHAEPEFEITDFGGKCSSPTAKPASVGLF